MIVVFIVVLVVLVVIVVVDVDVIFVVFVVVAVNFACCCYFCLLLLFPFLVCVSRLTDADGKIFMSLTIKRNESIKQGRTHGISRS